MRDLENAVENLRKAFARAAKELERSMRAATGNVHEAVSQRVQLAKDLGIASNLGLLLETLENQPSQTLLGEWREPVRPKNIKHTKDERRSRVTFTLGEDMFQLDLEVGRPVTVPDGAFYQFAEMTFTRGRAVLFEATLRVGRDRDLGYGNHPARGRVESLNSFLTGEWVTQITECAEGLRHAHEVERIKKKYDPEKARELTQRFGLDQEGDGWRPNAESALLTAEKVPAPKSQLVRRFLSWSYASLGLVLGAGVLIAGVLAGAVALFYVFGLWAVGIVIGFGLLVLGGITGGR